MVMTHDAPVEHVGQAPVSKLAALLYDYMRREGVSTYQLAARTGISRQTISKILNGISDPHPGTLAAIAQGTTIPLTALQLAAKEAPPDIPPVVWDYIAGEFEQATHLDPEERAHVREIIRYLRERQQRGQAGQRETEE